MDGKKMFRTDDPHFADIIQKLLEDNEDDEEFVDSEEEDASTSNSSDRKFGKEARSSISGEGASTAGTSRKYHFPQPSCSHHSDETANASSKRNEQSSFLEVEGHSSTDSDYCPSFSREGSLSECTDDDTDDEVSVEESGASFQSTIIEEEIIYDSKSGTNRWCWKWTSKEPQRRGRPPAHNILKFKCPGPSKTAFSRLGSAPSELNVWKQFIDDEMIQKILECTQAHLEESRLNVSSSNIRNYYKISIDEINAFIGLLLLTSIYKSNRESAKSLFATGYRGRPIFRAIMSYRRFTVLKEALRFDDRATRVERKKSDPAAPISEIFTKLVLNSQLVYTLGEYCTVDESLLPFRGRAKFRVYMPNKPAKYGIKLMVLTDARTSFFYNSYIYTGKGTDGKKLTAKEKKLGVPTQALITISQPIHNSNRNITADNWFSSIEAVRELRNRGLTYVGTMKKNKRELPFEFTNHKNRPLKDELYGFSEDGKIMIFSSKVKSTKVLNIVSSIHNSIGERCNGKSELNAFYNRTKGGVDAMDFKCALYSTQRKDERWPMCVFSVMLNIALVNSFIIHKSFESSALESRFKFTEKLALQLIEPHLRNRLVNPKINSDVKMWIKKILKTEQTTPEIERAQIADCNDRLEKRKYCSFCDYRKHRYTNFKCVRCGLPTCMECSRKYCLPCVLVSCKKKD